MVVRTTPEPFAEVDDLGVTIRFEFDERISERASTGTLDGAVTISPKAGRVRVSHSRRAISARVEGGLRPGLVYRVTLQPVVSDMFGNQLADPFELVFTTGADATPTTLAGEVWDRITGRGVSDATVHAVGVDSLVHLSTANREGIYAFRYLPAGDFTVVAFEDRDRDGQVDTTEVQGAAAATLAAGDTLLLDVALLTYDTLPGLLTRAQALDSVTVSVTLDDFLDPAQAPDSVIVELQLGQGIAPAVERLYHEADYVAYVDMVSDSFARLDSLDRAEAAARAAAAADTAVGPPQDTTGAGVAPPDTVVIGAPQVPVRRPPPSLEPLAGSQPGPVEGTDRVLPGRRLVAILAEPLTPDVEYTVRVSGVRSINGLSGGGGETTLLLPSPPPDTTVVDTVLGPDTGVVRPRGAPGGVFDPIRRVP